jgi:lipid-binding SYLF domain-containing protein
MRRAIRSSTLAGVAIIATLVSVAARPACAASASELNRDATAALNRLYSQQKSAKMLSQKAKAVLVFPSIVKAGFMFGGAIGDGVLRKGGRTAGYYNSIAASYGFQAGIQSFSYALFFMTDAALAALDASGGFELGVGPSVVVVDEGMGRSLTTTTARSDVYAFIFGQRGLMAGMGVQGSKITRIAK